MSGITMTDRVADVTYEQMLPYIIGQMFGPKAQAWFEKWRNSQECKQTGRLERIAYRRLQDQHPKIRNLNRRTLIGRQYLADRDRLYKQFVAREGEMPDESIASRIFSRPKI